jgi:predicted metal-binding membrane protein
MASQAAAAWPIRRIAREQAVLAGALIALAIVCWWLTDRRMDGMAMGPTLDVGGFGFYVGVWVVMMAAMMFPSVWPIVGMYDRIRAARAVPKSGTALVVIGYLATWTAWGVLAFAAIKLARAVFGDFLPWDGAGQYTAAAVVLLAAVYQVTPWKDACLTRCRGPITFVMENWRPGLWGAFRMGAVHGAWCVGCCWALMAALFAVGVMSIGWMAFIAALIAIEKLWPSRVVANWSVTIVLLVLGVALLVDPSVVPGMPDSGSHMQPMQMQGGDSMQGGSMDSGGSMP